MKIIFLLLVTLSFGDCAKVLMVLPLGSESHKNIFIPLAQELGRIGHDVTLVSMHSSKDNGTHGLYQDVAATDAWEAVRKATGGFNVFQMRANGGGKNVNSQVMRKVLDHVHDYCDAFLRDPHVQDAWNSRPDLILLPAFMNECGLALVHKHQVPFIYVTTSGLTPWTADLLGNPENPSFVPNQYLSYGERMNIWERTINTLVRIASPILRQRVILNPIENVVQDFLGDSTVSLAALEKNVSLVFVNSHYSLGFPRPLMPNVIEVGAMHCRPAKKVEDAALLKFLDSSKQPVVYFSLGSHVRSEQLPESVRTTLISTFTKLPYRFVWKWEGASLAGLPSNVMTRPWLSQQDVLGHKNVKAFITHGGLLSLQESVYHGVPMVGLPLMSDQHLNIGQAQTLGIATQLKIESMTSSDLMAAIQAVVEQPEFSMKIQQRSMLLKDQETTPLQRAVYWTQHVLRHGGAGHLRSAAADLPFYQYFLLDVAALLFIITTVLLFVLRMLSKFLFPRLIRFMTFVSNASMKIALRRHWK